MKKLISVILALVLILASMPLTAAAKETSIEQKLRLLLEDMELDSAYSVDRLLYEEKAQYPAQDPEWVLIRAEMIPEGSAAVTDGHVGVFGNKIILSQPYTCVPFALGWGVFDVKSNAFYDLIDAWDMGFDSLHEIWNGLKSDGAVKLIGDADGDGALSILDATRIQRVLVDLESEPHELYEQLDQSDFVHGYPIGCVSDYDRDGSLTILDATKIQRGIAGFPNMIDFKTSVNERADKEGVQADLDARLLTDTELFSAFCSSYLTGDLAARILAAYPDDYFRTGALIGIYDYLPGGSDTLTPRSLTLGNDASLTVDLLLGKPQPDLDGTTDENPRFILLEISKAFTDEISDVQLNVTAEKETSSIITEIPYYSQITASTPDDLNSAGYKKVAGEELTVTYRGRAYYEFDGPLNYTQTGYVMLLRSRKDFEHYLPEFDKEGALDDAFFNDYAVLAMLQHGGAGEAYAVLSDIAVYNETTLWCSSRIDYNYWYIDPDTPALSPTDPVVWTFVKIKQSDVCYVDSISFWRSDQNHMKSIDVEFDDINNVYFHSRVTAHVTGGTAPYQYKYTVRGTFHGYSDYDPDQYGEYHDDESAEPMPGNVTLTTGWVDSSVTTLPTKGITYGDTFTLVVTVKDANGEIWSTSADFVNDGALED